mgnify:FL=1
MALEIFVFLLLDLLERFPFFPQSSSMTEDSLDDLLNRNFSSRCLISLLLADEWHIWLISWATVSATEICDAVFSIVEELEGFGILRVVVKLRFDPTKLVAKELGYLELEILVSATRSMYSWFISSSYRFWSNTARGPVSKLET